MASIAYIPTRTLIRLLRDADPKGDAYVKVQSASRLTLGTDPLQPNVAIDLSKEKVVPCAEVAKSAQGEAESVRNAIPTASRKTGNYWFEIQGQRIICHAQKEILIEGLRAIEDVRPGTLDKLADIKPRSRRIVSRFRQRLFEKQSLVKYSTKLNDEWWVGTNNSAAETNTWLERACHCAGLKWGTEFKTSLIPTIEELA